ncbi:MAG: PAS domain S-box protein [Lachnospiraceae bacterium]|nr:PAS domain S-box protein [Lachnospiraceae bacterium]
MYHCHIHFYLVGGQCSAFEEIKKMPPLEHFTHEFMESDVPAETLTANADVILACLNGEDVKETVRTLVSGKKNGAELILIADKKDSLEGYSLEEINDIWSLPMSDDEIRFRFSRWQQTYKTGKDLWKTEQYLETIINGNPSLIWFKDKDGIHKKVNDSFCNMVGKTKEQVEGRDHAYIWDVDADDPACTESDNEVMSRKQTCESEEIIKTGDGMKTLTTYKSPLFDIDGSVMGTVGVAIDVTQERAYKKEILKKNRNLEKIFTTIDCGVIRHTLDGDILSINRAALKILGYESKEELIADGFKMVASTVVEKDKKKLYDRIMTLKNEGDSVGVNYSVRHKDGEIVHVLGDIKLQMDNGELIYQRFLLDCTEQKIQENKKERHHVELVHALSIDYSLVCFFDLETGMGEQLQNDGTNGDLVDSIFGGEISMRESIGRYIQEVVYEDDREMMLQSLSMENLQAEFSEKNIYYINYRALIDGKAAYYQMKLVRTGIWEEKQGVVLGLLCADEEMRKDMEKRDLLEAALLQANQASKAKSTFLSNMSHDIRTPMNAIVGFTNLAIAHIDNTPQVEEYLGKIMTSGNHLLRLINNVLDMSRIESGKVQLEEKPYNLADILDGLRSILQADINAKHMKLNIDTKNVANVNIYCDVLRLNQVLLNLISNSVKYTNNGGTVSVKVTEKDGAPSGYANYEFRIKDNGIGMSEEFVEHIFEPFEREKNSTLSGVQGTGLGMAITKNIVDMMSGTINVKSKQGVGTEFTLCLMFRLYSEEEKQQDVMETGKVSSSVKSRTGRILLAEDIELNQEVAVAILGDAGFETEVAENGQIAVDMLKKSEPGYYQLVLMDVQMPVMNGYEAAKEIRRLENKELASIPIIAMTANAFEEDRREAEKSGMNGHIAKPIDVENLFATLDKILC